ncbi:hypothetical protein [Chitinophaga caeni]|uniref:hypothetical protein n=1 Tax=Chitinophaga caeni TaxID=2029983 RepID=UPI0012FE37C7|nr:hypothetical protein [Chitinophaga caeni]
MDYYPFGMQMPGRVFNGVGYRYGFNGQEKSNEIKGEGNSYTAKFWEYDPRLGSRWNVDLKPTVGISDYAAFANNPIFNADPLGDTLRPLTTHVLRDMARKTGFTGTGIVFNRKVGKAFEMIGLYGGGFGSENTTRFTSTERSYATAGTSTSVIPDGVRSAKKIQIRLIPPGLKTSIYPNSSFAEVKAVNGVISLSSNNHQIRGELDALKNTAGGKAGVGTMTFITTANTVIGPDVIEYAMANKLKVYQVFSFQETDDNSIHFSPPIPLALPVNGKNVPIDVTPIVKLVDIKFGYMLNPRWVRPENPKNPDVEEVEQ